MIEKQIILKKPFDRCYSKQWLNYKRRQNQTSVGIIKQPEFFEALCGYDNLEKFNQPWRKTTRIAAVIQRNHPKSSQVHNLKPN